MNAHEIKAALNGRAEEFVQWLFPAGKRDGNEWHVGSLYGERGKSLGICIGGSKIGVFCDFATGESGDNLVELYGRAKQLDFKTALKHCANWLDVSLTPGCKTRQIPPRANHKSPVAAQSTVDFLSDEKCRRAIQMAICLRNNPKLCERIASARGWKTETIRDLTFGPSLGWYEGKLAFIYESGVKLRWRQDGERIVRWAFGKPWLWRGGLISAASTVYLSEGETDAISLIDAGVELDERTVAVALPSASTFDERWVKLFDGKGVILVLDGDKAGRDATRRLSRLLQTHVESLKQLNWRGLQHAS
jgi:5S rRNA maturation endonuclease (ribonuclease M5)